MIDSFRQTQQKQGFSSQQQFNQENFQLNNLKKSKIEEPQQLQKSRKITISTVTPAQQIIKKQYSLQPDMITGWKPKVYLSKPIPLIFKNDALDYYIDPLIKRKTYTQKINKEIINLNQNNNADLEQKTILVQLVYLGPRYESTYSAWYQKPMNFPYLHLNKSKRLRFTDRQFVGQYWNAQSQNYLHFDSFFQSGNLDIVFKVDPFEYDLFMRVDSNTRGHLQWYNFKVKNMKKGQTYKFNICNFLKGKSLYLRGMKPYIYSKRKYQTQKKGWYQGGQNITYQKKIPKALKLTKTSIQTKQFKLSFQYLCEFQQDQVQFAYCIPYEYSRLQKFLQKLQQKYHDKNFLRISKISQSLGGLQIPIITITSNIKDHDQNKKCTQKKLIFASGRIHPGQSNGSFLIEGFIQYLCRDQPQCQMLRNSIVFKIVPMVNPDGVVIGNYRTSLSGKDLNRQFVSPDQQIFPEIYNLKRCIMKYHELYKNDFMLYLDFHGHSTKKNCFTYGPDYPITSNSYYECRLFPKIIAMQTLMFRFYSCIFKISTCKQTTLRAVFLRQFGINLVYTIQVSNGFYYNHDKMQDQRFNQEKWLQMGQFIGKSINQYNKVFLEIQKVRKTNKQEKLKIKKLKDRLRIKNSFLSKEKDKRILSKNKNRVTFSSLRKNQYKKDINKISNEPNYNESNLNSPIKGKRAISASTLQFKNIFQDSKKDQDTQKFFGIGKFQDQNLNSLLKGIYGFDKKQVQHKLKLSPRSDDNISQGGSDSSSASQDFTDQMKKQLFKNIKKGTQKINSHFRSKSLSGQPNLYKQINDFNNFEEKRRQNQSAFLTTQMIDQHNYQMQKLNKINKSNSIKMNQLRTKKYIFIKKKSNNFGTPSPTKMDRSQTAKIVNFQFNLNPIKQISHIWTNQSQKNSYSSKIKFNLNKTQKNCEQKLLENDHTESYKYQKSQRQFQQNFIYPFEITPRSKNQQILQSSQKNFYSTFINNSKKLIQPSMSQFLNSKNESIYSVRTRNNLALRKTQQRKPLLNGTFYKALNNTTKISKRPIQQGFSMKIKGIDKNKNQQSVPRNKTFSEGEVER